MDTYTVKLYVAPSRSSVLLSKKTVPSPTGIPGFTVQARNIDIARKMAKAKLTEERGEQVRSLSIGTDGCLHIVVLHPDDKNL